LAVFFLLAGCGDYTEEEREIGYRGKARLDPFLAAERFFERLGRNVEVDRSWPKAGHSVAMMVMPASMLEAKGYVEEVRRWVARGGHLVCLFTWASPLRNDWNAFPERSPEISEPLDEWLRRAGWRVNEKTKGEFPEWVVVEKTGKKEEGKPGETTKTEEWEFDGRTFRARKFGPRLFAPIGAETAGNGEDAEAFRRFVSGPYGKGRLTLVADARPFRSRYIGEEDHASLLAAMVRASRPGSVVVVLGTDVSFWRLVWANGWTVILALVALTILWLWRSLPRFGPTEANVRVDDWRDYRRHLDAVGGFFWRTDRGQSLLAPLRNEVLERLRRRRAVAGSEAELSALAATLSGLPPDRVRQALDETIRHDPAGFTRTTADLQRLLERL
jgi:hypothetical protein